MYRVVNAGDWTIYEADDLQDAIAWAERRISDVWITEHDRYYPAAIVDQEGEKVWRAKR